MNERQSNLKLNAVNGGKAFSIMMFVYVIISFVGQALCGAIFEQGSFAYVAVCSIFSSLSLLGVILYFVLFGKNEFSTTAGVKNSGGVYLIVGLLLSLGMFAGLGFVNGAIAQMLETIGISVSGINLEMPSVWHFIVYSITFAVLPAVIEELFFRGLLLNSLSESKRIVAVVITAVCFAFYHCSLAQFVYQFIYGFLLGCLAIVAKSVIPGMIAHFVNNFAVILFTYLGVEINLLDPVVLLVGINALAIFSTIMFFALRKTKNTQSQKGEGSKFLLPFGSLGLIICIVLLVGSALV